MSKLRSVEDPDGWVREVRDPAEKASEGKRVIASGDAKAEYEIAPLPSGSWAMLMSCSTPLSGMTVPWREFPTRAESVATFLEDARRFFERDGAVGKAKAKARARIVELLTERGLFGFAEPEPKAQG